MYFIVYIFYFRLRVESGCYMAREAFGQLWLMCWRNYGTGKKNKGVKHSNTLKFSHFTPTPFLNILLRLHFIVCKSLKCVKWKFISSIHAFFLLVALTENGQGIFGSQHSIWGLDLQSNCTHL